MSCRDIQDLIMTGYLDGESTADVRNKVEVWFSTAALWRWAL